MCVYVYVFTRQSEVQAVARKHILWQHAVLLSDTAQEHDVRYSGCGEAIALRSQPPPPALLPLCESFPSQQESLSMSLFLLILVMVKPLHKCLGVQGQQENCLYLTLRICRPVCARFRCLSATLSRFIPSVLETSSWLWQK